MLEDTLPNIIRVLINAVYAIKEENEMVYIGESKNSQNRLFQCFDMKKDGGLIEFMRDLSPLKRKMKYTWEILWHGDDGDNDDDRKLSRKN